MKFSNILMMALMLSACQSTENNQSSEKESAAENDVSQSASKKSPQPIGNPNEAQQAIEAQAHFVKNNPEFTALQPQAAPRKAPQLIDANPIKPIVKVEPQYPVKAAREAIEGWVLLKFDIDETGATKNIKMIDASPPQLFEKAAMNALAKWRYKPILINGQIVELTSQQTVIEFKLSK